MEPWDGANVEIVEEVGIENAFIFGLSSDEVINFENNGGYDPYEIYNGDPDVRRVVEQLVDGTYSHGDHEMYRDLYNSLLKPTDGNRGRHVLHPERLPRVCTGTGKSRSRVP